MVRRLARVLTCLVLLISAPQLMAQAPVMPPEAEFVKLLAFEGDHPAGGAPAGWTAAPTGRAFADDRVVHGGRWSVRLEVAAGQAGGSSVSRPIPVEFGGSRIELRGYLRLDSVTGFAGLWLNELGDAGSVAFDNMQSRQLKGTADWAQYSVSVPVHAEAKRLVFGVLMTGSGKVWADDLELLVDDKPIWNAPHVERPKTALDLDHDFDAGSGIALQSLSPIQIENLATLGKVWGFLKYHHPAVAQGARHWDYELFRVLPGVLAAADRTAANALILAWVNKVGPVAACAPCAALTEKDLQLRPPTDWLADEARLGKDLSRALRDVYRNRPSGDRQFYVSLTPGVGNPSFDHELAYPDLKLPDAGYQLLSLFRFWNIIEYWSPNRGIMGVDWDATLPPFIPRIALAKTGDAYKLEVIALIATVSDTHANLWSSLSVRPPTGGCQLPVHVRFIENSAVVAAYTSKAAGTASGLKVGDIITGLDGKRVSGLVQSWTPYYAASNEPTRLRDIGRSLTKGACGETTVDVRRGTESVTLRATRVPIPTSAEEAILAHDLPGDWFRLLSDKVAYLKLSSVKSGEVAARLQSASATQGLIIDMRNYPSEFVVFYLGSLLVTKPTPFVCFTNGDVANPGAFRWRETLSLPPGRPHYGGKVVVLVDEVSQSQAEYTTMALRAAGALVVGSTTAGADGNVSRVPLPGGLSSMISGIGVFYPDKKPTQRVGIVPDVEVRPTIAGVRAGRDEVLEEALRRILGASTSSSEIERIAREARTVPTSTKPSQVP